MLEWGGIREGVFSLRSLACGDIQPPPPLFNGLILDNTITMISAPPFTGKSLLMADMCVALDTGLPLLDKYPPPEVKRVLAIMQDAPTWDYAEQLRKIIRGRQLDKEQLELLESTLVVNRDVLIDDPKFLPLLFAKHEETRFNVLMLDAFWCIQFGDERDGAHMAHVVSILKRIRDRLGCAIILSHHIVKARGEDYTSMNVNHLARGHGNLTAGIDNNLYLKRKGQRVEIVMGKGRGSDEQNVLFDIVEVDHPEGTALKLVAVDENSTLRGRMLVFLAEPRNRTQLTEFVRAFVPKLTEAQATKAASNTLQNLASTGKAVRVSHGVWQAKV